MITVALKSSLRRNAQPEKSEYVIVNWRISSHPHAWHPPTDVFEREDSLVVRVEVAGMNESDFTITLEQNLLVVRGSRADTAERRAYHQMEINFGEFMTAVEIGMPIDAERVTAEYQNGFLWVVLPKTQPQEIKISGNE